MRKSHRKGGKKRQQLSSTRLSLNEAIQVAVELHQHSNLDKAETLYHRILSVSPNNPEALHFLGVLQFQHGNADEAIRLIRDALHYAPEYMDAYNNLGNVYREKNELQEAESCYRRAIELNPHHAGVYNNLGTVLRAIGDESGAEAAYLKSISLDPKAFSPYENMGNLLSRQGKVREAVAHYSQAIVLNPKHPGSKRMLGIALSCIGKLDEAAQVFREWWKEDPDNPVAAHLLAACSGELVPERATDAYIKTVFDNFSSHFEERLERLEYRAPELIAGAVAASMGEPSGKFVILDAGCGTGLCGPMVRAYAEKLEGVDLSTGMLQRANATKCYDVLMEAELTDFMASHKDYYDVIISADTLCYFGNLSTVMFAAASALRTGGCFIFTVESALEDDSTVIEGFYLAPQGRYRHQREYVETTVLRAGLKINSLSTVVLRKEMGAPVKGLLVTAVRDVVEVINPK